jgi:hypothetical protein
MLTWTRRDFFPYRENRFKAWLDELYARETQNPLAGNVAPRLSREAYRYGIQQLAPAILVDGAWLQNWAEIGIEPVRRRLAAIYADEVGAGDPERNHPQIYRRLLESLDIHLPGAGSAEFAAHPDFLDAAFELPVYLLSIGLTPTAFLPELLGLNLAIEFSGLGRVYQRLARDLEHWGIDSRIVRLHLSIDNYASGHAALAKEAIAIFLEETRKSGCEPLRQEMWRRVWTGYHALAASTRWFKLALACGYGRQRCNAILARR